MNKYQEAIEVFAKHTRLTPHNIDELQWADEVLQELVDKEKPMKPSKQYKREYKLGNSGTCGNCNKSIFYQQIYCPFCRQKTDWSVED